jgi:AcrR family transcriptional regulator
VIDSPHRSSARALQTRSRILSAAEDLVVAAGADALTIERAAERAGVAKGTVLYHFPTRRALIQAMVARCCDSFDLDMAEVADPRPAPGRRTRAYVRASFGDERSDEQEREARLSGALLAASATDPGLLEPLRVAYRRWQAELEMDGLDPAVATVARLAADGLWLAEIGDLAPPRGELRRRVLAVLEDMAGGGRRP